MQISEAETRHCQGGRPDISGATSPQQYCTPIHRRPKLWVLYVSQVINCQEQMTLFWDVRSACFRQGIRVCDHSPVAMPVFHTVITQISVLAVFVFVLVATLGSAESKVKVNVLFFKYNKTIQVQFARTRPEKSVNLTNSGRNTTENI